MTSSIPRLPTTDDGCFDAVAHIRAKAPQLGIDVPADLLPAVAALLEVMAAGADSLRGPLDLPEDRRDQD